MRESLSADGPAGEAGSETGLDPRAESTGDLLMLAARLLRRRFSAALEEYDVSPSQARALRAVVASQGIRLSALAERLRIAPRTATDVVDALEGRGLITRSPDARDRRATVVTATPGGIELHAAIHQARHRELDGFEARLKRDDREALHRLLRFVVEDLGADSAP